MPKPLAADLAAQGDRYVGTPYKTMDCQAFIERCLRDVGIRMDLAGSNAWFRAMTWTGCPEECKKVFGRIPIGALLYIWADDDGEKKRGYHDGLGNASHIGIYIGRNDGAIASSSARQMVQYSKFAGKTINGGWNRVGLWDAMSYGADIDSKLQTLKKGTNQMTALPGAYIKSANGLGAVLREKNSSSSKAMTTIPDGEVVGIIEQLDRRSKVQYRDQIGYVLNTLINYGVPEDGAVADDRAESDEPVAIHLSRRAALELYDACAASLGLVGVG